MKPNLLYVDDERDNLIVFEAAFEDDFNLFFACGGKEALEQLDRHPIPVVVSDQRMPEMTGVELFSIMRRKHPHIQRIILTGYTDPDAMIEAINRGQVFHFVKKPWERPFLHSVLIRAFQTHDLAVANSALTDQLVLSERLALLGQATARLAHELSNHLCMLPLVEYIEEHCANDAAVLELARHARNSLVRVTAMIHEVMSFMALKPEELALSDVSVLEILHELVSFLRFDRSIPSHAIAIEAKSDPIVLGNRVKLQQVFVNLIKNAAYAIHDRSAGRITISIETSGNRALVKVSDNGCGIEPDVLPRIWDPFFTTKGNAGNGLGLDVSRKFVEAHQGTIVCQSQPGAGTTFEIRLPLAFGEGVESRK
jgi:signal transduction histidine kinase